MRTLRVLVAAVLAVGGLALLAPGASASAPAVSKTCKSLNALNKNLDKIDPSSNSGGFDSHAINGVSKAFRKAAKTGPKSLKSAMNTIADVYADVAHADSPVGAVGALGKAGQKFSAAIGTWTTYLVTNCSSLK